MTRFQGKTALITGATRGLGLSVARLLHAEGANLILASLDSSMGQQAADSLPGSSFFRLDVTDEHQWQALAKHLQSQSVRLDALVNNAGIVRYEPITQCSTESFQQVLAVNLLGPFLALRELAPLLANPASVVNISSCAGLEGINGACSYVASKAALTGLTKAAALEFAHRGVRVNSVHPSAIATDMVASQSADAETSAYFAGQAIPRYASPIEVARMVAFLASDESSYCTGAAYLVDGGHMAGRILNSMAVS